MKVEPRFEFVFRLTYILAVVAFVTVKHVYDVFCFACESVSYMKCFQCLHAFECGGLDEVVGADGACFVAFEASRGVCFGSGKDGRHEEGLNVPSVPFSYNG